MCTSLLQNKIQLPSSRDCFEARRVYLAVMALALSVERRSLRSADEPSHPDTSAPPRTLSCAVSLPSTAGFLHLPSNFESPTPINPDVPQIVKTGPYLPCLSWILGLFCLSHPSSFFSFLEPKLCLDPSDAPENIWLRSPPPSIDNAVATVSFCLSSCLPLPHLVLVLRSL